MNINHVAARAGVSTATVSRILNGKGPVKSSTRARVLKVMSELKYQPNLNARALAGAHNHTLGLITASLINPFFVDVLQRIEKEALAAGYEIAAVVSGGDPEQLASSIGLMIGRRVAGLVIIVPGVSAALIELLVDPGIPTVLCDCAESGPADGMTAANVTRIQVNYQAGIERITDYLRSLGHVRIGFVACSAAAGTGSYRQRTFLEVIERCFPVVHSRIAPCTDDLEGGRQATSELLNKGFAPTAFVCVNDLVALGALREIRERGLRVPGDVSVTGFDNISISEFCNPPLTTVHVPRDRVGSIAFDYLRTHTPATRSTGAHILVAPDFIVRNSTGCAAANR
ncbi:MAG: LacI family DNA-binding transcriptional regulator [Bryobacteraceae bacterium]|jgi:DNA-binding LacI/PurR family transcriptional regulator